MSEPSQALLKDLLVTTKDGDWGKAEEEDGYLPYNVIRATDFGDVSLGFSGKVPLRYLSEKTVARRTLQVDDVLIETAGGSPGRPTGRTMLVTDRVLSAFSLPITCASFARFMRVDRKLVDPQYLYWYLQSLYLSGAIEQYQVQHTGVARFQYTDFASTHRIPLLDLKEQRGIAEVLGAFDDKVAVNAKAANITEDLLHASYRSLVSTSSSQQVRVRDLVKRISPLRKFDKAELVGKGDFPVFDQSESGLLGYLMGDGFFDASPEEPILYFGDHTCKLRIAAQKFTVGPNTIPFTGVSIPSLTLYCALKGIQLHEEYKRHWQLLLEKEVSVPDTKDAHDFAFRHRSTLALSKNLMRENELLTAARDALIPHLLSGKLQVKDAEALVESVV